MSVLNSSATKREAKSYIQRFTPSKEPVPVTTTPIIPDSKQPGVCTNGVNLGGFYGPAAVQGSPKFVQLPQKQTKDIAGPHLHVALVKIRAPQSLDDNTLNGIGRTLSQLERLGLISVVVVDCNDTNGPISTTSENTNWRVFEAQQADRILNAIETSGNTHARLVDNVIGIYEETSETGQTQTGTHVTFRNMLMTPLRKGVIPVIPSIGYTDIAQVVTKIPATEVVKALAEELAGISTDPLLDEEPDASLERLKRFRNEVSLDRLIILDPFGGIPSTDRLNGYHVFLNMEQEFEAARQDLVNGLEPEESALEIKSNKEGVSDLGASNPFSRFVETEITMPLVSSKSLTPTESVAKRTKENWHHIENLELARSVLTILPPSSSVLLTSPNEAANSGKELPFQATGVGTRRQRNPLIHNLLTDRPVFSSSLPVGRLGVKATAKGSMSLKDIITPTTFAKHGTLVTIFPDPKLGPWVPALPGQSRLSLTDSTVDLPRFVHLIEDSFGRKLDVEAYLNRVNDRIAGIIIAGDYEGGALLTWETPPGVIDDGSPESRARMVPYLDKFAVLKKKQGSATADLVFKAMVRDCFPQGVCWRSRKNNVVNKWYFERSRGTWKLPDTGWTMFWTTPDLSMDRQTFLDYEGVCKGIEPSWAENKSLLD